MDTAGGWQRLQVPVAGLCKQERPVQQVGRVPPRDQPLQPSPVPMTPELIILLLLF